MFEWERKQDQAYLSSPLVTFNSKSNAFMPSFFFRFSVILLGTVSHVVVTESPGDDNAKGHGHSLKTDRFLFGSF